VPTEALSIAVEDKYLIFDASRPNGMLGEDGDVELLIEAFKPFKTIYNPIIDLSNNEVITSDVVEFIRQWGTDVDIILDRKLYEEWEFRGTLKQDWPRNFGEIIPIDRRDWQFHQFTLLSQGLEDEYTFSVEDFFALGEVTEEEWKHHRGHFSDFRSLRDLNEYIASGGNDEALNALYRKRLPISETPSTLGSVFLNHCRDLADTLRTAGRNSLLTQLALIPGKDGGITAVPIHSHALYDTRTSSATEQVILARPGIIAAQTGAIFQNELTEFNDLLSRRSTTEPRYQRFLEEHPAFLNMLGYKQAYPKIILEREDGTSLVPDFMIEPFDQEFWDVLDIKLPTARLITGRRDRKKFSSEVHQLFGQLREYAAYFDDAKNRARIQERYGISAYKPRMIGIIGINYETNDKLQLQRVKSQYRDYKLWTFEDLRQIARRRLLI
jgi:hypothetical protein